MAKRWFGDRSRFAVEVGEFVGESDAHRRVDVWAAGVLLTCDDNHVYVPHFAGCLQHAVSRVLDDPTYRRLRRPDPETCIADNFRRLRAEEDNSEFWSYRFMHWGPTADNVMMLLFREDGVAYLPFAFWRPDHHDPSELGQVFVAELPERELAMVLHDAAWFVMWAWADRSKWPTPAPRVLPEGNRNQP